MKLLKPLEISECPFRERPKTNERPHWVQPKLVAQIKFTEWTADGKLRHPVYLGLRDDKKPEEIVARAGVEAACGERQSGLKPASAKATAVKNRTGVQTRPRTRPRSWRERPALAGPSSTSSASSKMRARDGVLELPDGDRLKVTNLHKIFWPKQKLTKGDLFRYYVAGRAVHPAGGRGPAAGHEAISQRRRRAAVLSASRRGCARRACASRRSRSRRSASRSSAAT